MILHAKYGQVFVSHSLDRLIVQIDVRDFNVGRKRVRIDRETMVLRRDGDFAAAQIFDRLVRPAMAEFQFEGRSTERETEDLMAETNAENRLLAHQIAHNVVRVGQCRWIPGAIREEDSVRVFREYFVRARHCWNNCDGEAFLPQQAQNISFDPVIVSGDAKSNRRQGRAAFVAITVYDYGIK